MQMEKIYDLNGCSLLVVFENQLISIKRPRALQKFLSEDIDQRSSVFVNYIKLDYLNFIGKELVIDNESIIVEIWGHMYASYFAKALKNLIHLQLIENFSEFILNKSEIIDCGESEVDSNRKFWDILANFKGLILTFLPHKTKNSKSTT